MNLYTVIPVSDQGILDYLETEFFNKKNAKKAALNYIGAGYTDALIKEWTVVATGKTVATTGMGNYSTRIYTREGLDG